MYPYIISNCIFHETKGSFFSAFIRILTGGSEMLSAYYFLELGCILYTVRASEHDVVKLLVVGR